MAVGSNIVSVPRCWVVAFVWLAALRVASADSALDAELPPAQMKFQVFAGADGLRNLVIISIVQDPEGFLWLATEDGVYRFDGERFAHFSVDDGLSSSLVHVLGVAPDGNVCAGSGNGLVCWDGVRFSRAGARGVPEVPILNLATHDGRLWVGTDGAGLYVQGTGGVFAPAAGWPGLATTPVRAMWSDAGGLVVANGATVELSSGNGVWQDLGDVGLGRDHVEGVVRDRLGALWIRTPSHLWRLPAGATRATDLNEGLPTGYDATGAPSAMAIGPRGDVLIGTDDGITYRDHDRWRTIGHASGMPAATTRALLVDREGTIWIGSNGLFALRGRGLIEHYNVASGLPGEIVWTYQRDRQGTLWAGTNRCLARARAGRWECLHGTEDRVVRSIVFPPQGGMFIGGNPSDVLYIAPDGRTISSGEPDRPDHNVAALALGPDGDLWIGTKTGLYRLPGAVPGPLEPVAVPGVRENARFGSVVTVGNQLWATAAPGGVVVLDHGTWRVFGTSAGLRSESPSYMIVRNDGRFCTAYNEAIGATCFRYDGRTLRDLEHLRPADGLGTGMVYFLGEDREQRLWVGTGGGVDVVTPTGIDHLDDSDGLAGNDSASKAFLLDRDGSLWLGATGGATHVFAQYYHGPPSAPRTAFVGGRVGEHAIHGRNPALEVAHDRNAMTVEFAAGSMLDPRRVEYQVRLWPQEPEWSTTRQRVARYPGLLPGTYRFEARARVDAGRWGPTSALSFTVLPAWWQSTWFLGLLVVVGLGSLAGAVTSRQRAVLRRRTRQLHARSDASFRAVIDRMPDLLAVLRGGRLIYLNRASCRFLGVEAPGDRWGELDLNSLVHPDDREHVTELVRKIGAADATLSAEVIEVRMRGADGTWRYCEVSGVLVEIGGAPTVVMSGRDVTERKRMRAKLLVSDRMASLGTLAAGIAHEINNPLAYVTGNLEAAAEALKTAAIAPSEVVRTEHAELGAVIDEARDGAERVRKIVHGLRLFSRSEEENRVPLALPGVLETAIRLTANEVRHRAQLVRELGPVPLVVADDGQLAQVFINLLVNAAHAIPEGHSDDNRITVRTRTDDHGRAVVEIEDTGAGMPPEVQARVFDPFFTTKEVGGGTGLGLSICHGIISGLGGQISIDSAPARGTTVRVVLPAAIGIPAALPAAAEDTGPAPPPPRRQSVMLVDDEPLVAQTIERLLRRDYDITIALCGRDAIEHIARGTRFDAIVSDVMMPNMTGIELIEELRRMAPDQASRLIFLSGGAFTAQTRERLDQLGVLQLEKPVSAKELRASILRIAHGTKPG